MTNEELQQKIDTALANMKFYRLNSILGNANWGCMFYILIGPRACGKSYAVMEQFLKDWKKTKTQFYWIRLSKVSVDKLLKNKADLLIEQEFKQRFNLEITVKGGQVFDHGEPMCKVLALSEMAKLKGLAFYSKDYDGIYNIAIDEWMREPGEKNTFPILYNLVGTLETILRRTQKKVRIFMMANSLEEGSEILATGFDFIPEVPGRYYLKRKKAVIDLIQTTDAYKEYRKGSVADILTPTASNFTNELKRNKELLYKGKRDKPTALIKFFKDPDSWFVVWDGRIISEYKKESINNVIAMRPYIDELYMAQSRDAVVERFDARIFFFTDYKTQIKFQNELQRIRTAK